MLSIRLQWRRVGREGMSNFALWMIGFALVAIGVAVAMLLLGVMREWVFVFLVLLAGIGVMVSAWHRNRTPGPPAA